jgi:hypothetical protein
MLSRLVLLAAQLVVAWFGTRPILELLPPFGGLQIFLYGIVAAVLVWIVGLVLSQVLRNTGSPSSATLATCAALAVAGAALVYFREYLPMEFRSATRSLRDEIYPLVGAVLGYAIKR